MSPTAKVVLLITQRHVPHHRNCCVYVHSVIVTVYNMLYILSRYKEFNDDVYIIITFGPNMCAELTSEGRVQRRHRYVGDSFAAGILVVIVSAS